MKYVLLDTNNIVCEIIPEFNPLIPDATLQERYPSDFVMKLLSVEDDTEVFPGWEWDADLRVFSPPIYFPPTPEQQLAEVLPKMRGLQKAYMCLVNDGKITPDAEDINLFDIWRDHCDYTVNQYCYYQEKLYKCISAHTSQADWTPDVAVSLWVVAVDPSDPWPVWRQPLGSFDCYSNGTRVSYDGKHWLSTVKNNVWKPGVYGWVKAE